MPKLPAIKSKEMCRLIESLGYINVRQRGSHRFYKHPTLLRYTVVPMHNRDLGKGLLRKIISDISLTPQEFLKAYHDL